MADDGDKTEVEKPAEEKADSKRVEGKTMHVKIYAPFKVYYDDEAESISAVNDTGPFDILPRHHNFMTLISTGEVIVRHERGEEKIAIQRGVMHVKADEVVVFLDI